MSSRLPKRVYLVFDPNGEALGYATSKVGARRMVTHFTGGFRHLARLYHVVPYVPERAGGGA